VTVHVSMDATTRQCTVVFLLESDAVVGEVSVVGSFNGWTAGADPLVLQDDGTLMATVVVDVDHDVHFRYLAQDGVWFDDPDADEVTPAGAVIYLALPDDSAEQDDGHTRVDLLPEEQVVGSDDAQAQATSPTLRPGFTSRRRTWLASRPRPRREPPPRPPTPSDRDGQRSTRAWPGLFLPWGHDCCVNAVRRAFCGCRRRMGRCRCGRSGTAQWWRPGHRGGRHRHRRPGPPVPGPAGVRRDRR
jgi:hypothetical protein